MHVLYTAFNYNQQNNYNHNEKLIKTLSKLSLK